MGQELVREFGNLTKKFYSIFNDDLTESYGECETYIGIRSDVHTEEAYVEQYYSYSDFRPNKDIKVRKNRRKVGPVPVFAKRHIFKTIGSSINPQRMSLSLIKTLKWCRNPQLIIGKKISRSWLMVMITPLQFPI